MTAVPEYRLPVLDTIEAEPSVLSAQLAYMAGFCSLQAELLDPATTPDRATKLGHIVDIYAESLSAFDADFISSQTVRPTANFDEF